jgi:hypothetical protein
MIQFNKSTGISLFILAIVVYLNLKRYFYGFMILLLSIFVWIQFLLSNVNNASVIKYSNLTATPAYIMLGIITLTSLYIINQTNSLTTTNKVLSVSPFMISIFTVIMIQYLKDKYELMQTEFIGFLPMLFMMIFMLSTSIIPDNQNILRQTYYNKKEDIRQL